MIHENYIFHNIIFLINQKKGPTDDISSDGNMWFNALLLNVNFWVEVILGDIGSDPFFKCLSTAGPNFSLALIC
jgi:hypothetical protein